MSDQDKAKLEAAKAMGSCKAAVVKVDAPWHIILFILNIVFSGSGSMISACLCKDGFHKNAFIFGLLQFLFGWTIGPWIWSVVHGYWIYEAGK